jgi:hypothetical protein
VKAPRRPPAHVRKGADEPAAGGPSPAGTPPKGVHAIPWDLHDRPGGAGIAAPDRRRSRDLVVGLSAPGVDLPLYLGAPFRFSTPQTSKTPRRAWARPRSNLQSADPDGFRSSAVDPSTGAGDLWDDLAAAGVALPSFADSVTTRLRAKPPTLAVSFPRQVITWRSSWTSAFK